MAKRTKKTRQLANRGFGTKTIPQNKFDSQLRRVSKYVAENEWGEACQVLVRLSQKYPADPQVWHALADISVDAEDMVLYQQACERMYELEPSGDWAYALGSAYVVNLCPLMGLKTLRQALALDPNHKGATEAREIVEKLQPAEEEALESLGVEGAEGLDIAILHEQSQVHMNRGEYAKCRQIAESLLDQVPDCIPAHNNISLVSWQEGDVEGAIATAQSVLEMAPENIHALSNLIHFLVVSGDTESAIPYGERLKSSHAKAWDGWTKKVEGLSYLADDAGVVEIWHQAQKDGVEDSAASAMFYHLSAVALARTGNEKQAIKVWKTALARDPSITIAQENLQDIRQPASERHGAWPFPWQQWLLTKSSQRLFETIQSTLKVKQMDKVRAKFTTFLDRRGDVVAALPRIMERGGAEGQDFVLGLGEHLKIPVVQDAIKDFALSQNGSDKDRTRAINLAIEAKLLPPGEVTVWLKGEWRRVMAMAYTFHEDPLFDHAEAVQSLLTQATVCLQDETLASATQAEAMLREALELEPDAPDLSNNLALSLQMQERTDEFEALIRDVVERHPDYVYARVMLAQHILHQGAVEEAEAMLQPILAHERFHFQEFGTFAAVYVDLLVRKGEKDSARSWLQMWERVYPDDPNLAYWRSQLKGGFLKGGLRLPKLFR